MKAGRHICLYGSENLEWIRNFTKTMSSVASTANIPLKMVYVGERKPSSTEKAKRHIQSVIATIAEEKLSHSLPNYTSIWFFRERLEAMLVSKLKQRKTAEDDHVLWCLISLHNYARFATKFEEWAIFFGGENEMFVMDSGTRIMKALGEFKNWKEDVKQDGFESALEKYMQRYPMNESSDQSDTSHIFVPPPTIGELYDMASCTICRGSMEKYIMFQCNSGLSFVKK
ncbi:hypothetical protein L6164_033185 [Bauhinia variegata]|uniref:Uncharacterized protein n=1 Tax=Bauhinia variegata TaxID=167791 RepID=A0ACB9KR24_BAUVA|nr:hypothetical protein L6164_033185 [Bauhinia variegata]